MLVRFAFKLVHIQTDLTLFAPAALINQQP